MQSIFAVYNRILEKVTNFTAVLADILLFVPVFSIFMKSYLAGFSMNRRNGPRSYLPTASSWRDF